MLEVRLLVETLEALIRKWQGLNPYYAGSETVGWLLRIDSKDKLQVLILIMLEVRLLAASDFSVGADLQVS